MNRQAEAPRGMETPTGPHIIRAFVPRPGEHFTLPGDITKAGAIATITRAMQLRGAGALEILVFRLIADRTERLAWHSSTRAPVNWRRQCDLTREAGITERHFRRIEARLEALGVLARATADNGYRGRRAGQGWHEPVQCGLSLEPAIANYEAFVALCAQSDAHEDQRQHTLLHIRTARRRLARLALETGDMETRSWAQAALTALRDAFPPGRQRGADLDALLAHHAALLDLEDRIREAMTPLPHPAATHPAATDSGDCDATGDVGDTGGQKENNDPVDADPCSEPSRQQAQDGPVQARTEEPPASTPCAAASTRSEAEAEAQPTPKSGAVDNVGTQHNMSGAPDMGVRCHIQPQSNLPESCNAQSPSNRTPAYAGDRSSFASPPDGRDDGLGKKHRTPVAWINPAILQKLTPEALRDLASEDAALYLEAVQDWRDTLPYLLRDLGVNVSAWTGACDVMGEQAAFIALLVIDRNRFHPDTPVINPGGALRAFTDRARRGELNLTRAILGIWERDRQGTQPKAGDRPAPQN